MNIKLLTICFTLLVVIAGFSGCTEDDPPINAKNSDQLTSTEAEEETQIEEPELIENVLTKSENFESIYYEISVNMNISEFGEQNALIKIWHKDPYIKEEITSNSSGSSISIVAIQGPDGKYVYDAEKEKYIISTEEVSSITNSLQYFDNSMILQYISDYNISNYEKDVIDGKESFIIEYSPTELNDLIHVKIWIWTEKGLPLKGLIDMNMKEMSMSMELFYGNYSFDDISDSEFSVD